MSMDGTFYRDRVKAKFHCRKCSKLFRKGDELTIIVMNDVYQDEGDGMYYLDFWFQHKQCQKEKE